MIAIPANTLRRPQSMAWIAPDGAIIPLAGETMHSDAAETFPGVPAGEDYPTSFAMDKLGYMKVGNAFDFAYKGGRETPANHSLQFDSMAQIVCQAVINFITKSLPNWFVPSRTLIDDPERWIVHMGDIADGTVNRMSVKRFVRQYGSIDTQERFDHQLRRAEEALIRKQIRIILSELRRRPV